MMMMGLGEAGSRTGSGHLSRDNELHVTLRCAKDTKQSKLQATPTALQSEYNIALSYTQARSLHQTAVFVIRRFSARIIRDQELEATAASPTRHLTGCLSQVPDQSCPVTAESGTFSILRAEKTCAGNALVSPPTFEHWGACAGRQRLCLRASRSRRRLRSRRSADGSSNAQQFQFTDTVSFIPRDSRYDC